MQPTRQKQPYENISLIGSTVVQDIEELVENFQEKLHEKDKLFVTFFLAANESTVSYTYL